MSKTKLVAEYSDWLGGRNTTVSPDRLQANELVDCTNMRMAERYGALVKRAGSQRLHETTLGASVTGVFQWDAPGGKQLVAVADGSLFFLDEEDVEFTEEAPGMGDEFSITVPQKFQPFRAASSGAPLVLFIADGKVYKWTGTATELDRIDGVDNVPQADLLIAYHTRMFWRDTRFPKHVFWSVIGDAEDGTDDGALENGGSALVDVLTGESIVAFAVQGNSLLVSTRDSVVRFTGYSSLDIDIQQDTEGVSSEQGATGSQAFATADNVVYLVSDRGAQAAVESGLAPIGAKVERDFETEGPEDWIVQPHRGRGEVWFIKGDTVYPYSLRVKQWYGPFVYPFTITSAARYEMPDGSENIVAGCSDGFVRLMDIGTTDDRILVVEA